MGKIENQLDIQHGVLTMLRNSSEAASGLKDEGHMEKVRRGALNLFKD